MRPNQPLSKSRAFQLMTLYRTAQDHLDEDPRWTRILRKVRIRLNWSTSLAMSNPYDDPAKARWAETMWR